MVSVFETDGLVVRPDDTLVVLRFPAPGGR